MKKTLTPLTLLCAFVLLYGCDNPNNVEVVTENDKSLEILLSDKEKYLLLDSKTDFASLQQDAANVLTKDKIELGQYLFFEPALAVNTNKAISKKTYSCATCHIPSASFKSGLAQGIGEGGIGFGTYGEKRHKGSLYQDKDVDVLPIGTLSLLNLAYQKNIMWSGKAGATVENQSFAKVWLTDSIAQFNKLGFEGVEVRSIAGLKMHRMAIGQDILRNSTYKDLFDKAFPEIPLAQRYTDVTAGLAIAAYLRTLTSSEAPFQKWLRGDYEALTEQQKKGAILFFGKANCAKCHDNAALGGDSYYALGLNDLSVGLGLNRDPKVNLGRGGFTELAADKFKFKVPQLYGLSDSRHFGHGANFDNLRDFISYINEAKPQNTLIPKPQYDALFKPLQLSNEEINHIVDFLLIALQDEKLSRYEPASLPSGNCFPNNDPLSRYDLGCQ